MKKLILSLFLITAVVCAHAQGGVIPKPNEQRPSIMAICPLDSKVLVECTDGDMLAEIPFLVKSMDELYGIKLLKNVRMKTKQTIVLQKKRKLETIRIYSAGEC